MRDPLERLRQGGLAYFEFARSQPHYYAIMFAPRPDSAVDSTEPERTEKADARVMEFFHQCLQEAVAQGKVARSAAPWVLAHMLWSSLHGAASLALAGRCERLPREARLAYFKAALDKSIRGLRTPEGAR